MFVFVCFFVLFSSLIFIFIIPIARERNKIQQNIYSAATTSVDGGGFAAASFSNFSGDVAISCKMNKLQSFFSLETGCFENHMLVVNSLQFSCAQMPRSLFPKPNFR